MSLKSTTYDSELGRFPFNLKVISSPKGVSFVKSDVAIENSLVEGLKVTTDVSTEASVAGAMILQAS